MHQPAQIEASAPTPAADQPLLAVDVLRGLSALAVAMFHVRVHLWVGYRAIREDPGAYSQLDRLVASATLPVTQMGYAVMLFFVLSGFCIHWPNARPAAPALDLGNYARRRLLRIVPSYVVVVLLCLLVEFAVVRLGGPAPSPTLVQWASIPMLQTWLCSGDQLLSNPSLWSIPIEIELYAVYPLMLWLGTRRGFGSPVLLSALVSALAIALYAVLPPERAWTVVATFPKYWILWMSGAWLAERYRKRTLPPFGWPLALTAAATLVLALLCERWGVPSPYRHFVWGGLSFLILWYFLGLPAWFARLPGGLLRPLVGLGAISYSLYLIHFPFFYLAGTWWTQTFGRKPASYLVSLVFVALSVGLAFVFHRLIEGPSHRWARGGKSA